MATFALSEALLAVARHGSEPGRAADLLAKHSVRDMHISRSELAEAAPPTLRSSVLGFFVGLLPGAGATVASFLAYGTEQRLAPAAARERFGSGSIRGLAAPEAANNAAATGSFVPLLTLGLPGSGTTAILLGAFIAYGIQPGPMLYINEPKVFWG